VRLARPLKVTAALMFALMAVVTAGSWLGAMRYDAQVSRLLDCERAVFSQLYPNASVPPAVRKWLESESMRLAGVSGASGALPEQPFALETLRKVAAGLPKDTRLRILDLRIEPGEVFLEGQARSHADAEVVARGVASAGFVMEAPRTETLVKGGVAFTLAGKPGAPSAAAPAGKAPPKTATAAPTAAQTKDGRP
jgi:hypothetical protein